MKPTDVRVPRELDHPWHVAINRHDAPFRLSSGDVLGHANGAVADGKEFMYEAKHAAEETPRLALLFGMERRGELAKQHHQCSHDHVGEPVSDNHLTCCLGVECRKCPFLAAIDGVRTRQDYSVNPAAEVPVTDEERDVMKAWTCVAHILMRGGDPANEGFVLTEDDKRYWQNVYDSLAGGPPLDDDEPSVALSERREGDGQP